MRKIIVITAAFWMTGCCDCANDQFSEKASLLDITGTGAKDPKVVSDPVGRKLASNQEVHFGLDISHFQGDVMNYLDNKDSLTFVICKATQGITYLDPDFRTNWNAIEEKGFIRGTYHFYMFSDDPVKQAQHFAAYISDITDRDIAPIVDVEQAGLIKGISPATVQRQLTTFLKALEQRVQRRPIIYTDFGFAQQYLNDSGFQEYDLWLAEYTRAKKPLVPATWRSKGYKIWQRSDTYHAFSETIDLDVYTGPIRNLIEQ